MKIKLIPDFGSPFPIILGLFLILSAARVKGQAQHSSSERSEKGSHKLTLGFGHVYHQKTEETSYLKNHAIDVYAFNYDYRFSSHWSLGSHNDIIFEDLDEGEHKEKALPLTTKIIGAYHTGKHLSLMFGVGDEIVHKENILLSTIGADYGWHFKGGWELGAEVLYDLKFHAADDWIVGLGISKIISRHIH